MSHRSHLKRKLATPLASRRDVLTAAITPLLEMLEQRRHFSTAPVADIGGPYNVNEGQSILISGLASTDPDGTVASYQWDTNYSAGRGFRARFTGPTWTFTADDSGTRSIALRVTDNSGDTHITTGTISIADVAPTLSLTAPGTGAEGSPVNISWSHTDPGVSDTVTAWEVDWGDDTVTTYAGNINAASHTYAEDGNFVVTLTATQTSGDTSVTSNIAISQVTPIVVATTTTPEIDEGQMVQIDFASTNRQNSIEGWVIEWGDGNIDLLAPNRSHATHFYTDSGNYTATVSAQEPDGGAGTATVEYVVNNVAADIAITGLPGSADEGSSITVGSTVSDAGQDDTHVYGWTVYKDGEHFVLPGGTVDDGTTFTFTPTDNGNYVIRLTVVDDEGGSTTVNSDPIVVGNVNPTATISGEPVGSIDEGDTVNLSVTPADDSDDDATAGFTYAWSATKGGNAYDLGGATTDAASFAFTPRDNGTYIVSVVVTDKDSGAVTVSTASITVDNVAPAPAISGAPTNSNEGTEIEVSGAANDAGADDTHTYAWSVEKLGTAGTLTLDGNGSADLGNFFFGGGVTITSRMMIDSTMSDGTAYIFEGTAGAGAVSIGFTKSGSDVQFFITGMAGTRTATLNATPLDSYFDLAVTIGSSTAFYVDGQPVASSGANVGNPGGQTTAFGTNVKGVFDQVSVYAVELSDAGVEELYNEGSLSQTPRQQWDFSEGSGATTVVSTGTTPKSFDLENGWSLASAPAWQAFALPGGTNTAGTTFAFVPTDNGDYRIKLTVTDDDGSAVTTQTSTITIDNVAPTATLTGDDTADEGNAVTYTATPADVGSEDTHTYLWSVTKGGNAYDLTGVTVNQSSFTFTPDDNEDYVVSVVVTDDDGGAITLTHNLEVSNVAPDIAITGTPGTEDEGNAITLGSTYNDVAADAATYGWTVYRDGELFTLPGGTTTNASSFTFTPTDDGSYVVRLTALDGDGGSTTVNSDPIVVGNVNPTGTISGEPVGSIDEGTAVNLSVTPADGGSEDTFTYAWSVTKNGDAYDVDGLTTNADTFSFTPTDNGTYVATVVITDDNSGSVSVSTAAITVDNVAPVSSITGAPANANEGDEIEVGSTTTDAGTADTHTYAWSVTKDAQPFTLPGGLSTTDSTFSFVPTDNGDYVISLTVTDDDGSDVTTTSSTITVANVAPTAALTGDETGVEGSALNFNVAPADAGSDDTHTYLWSVTKGGNAYDLTGLTVNASTFSFTPDDNEAYVVSVVVTDDDGDSVTQTLNVTVANANPTGVITGAPTSSDEGTQISLGSTTADVGDDTLSFAWTVTKDGDAVDLTGITANASTFDFTPTDNGEYVFTLVVSDEDGGSVTDSKTVTVTNVNPTATVSGEPVSPIAEGAQVDLTATGADVSTDDTLSYAWTITKDGDAWTPLNGTVLDQATLSFVPTDNGTYVATVTVTDDDNGSSSTDSQPIIVTNAAPVISITGSPVGGDEGTAITVGSTVADDGAADTHTYAWSVTKDGNAVDLTGVTTDAASFTFTPADNGAYVISLTVTDDDNDTDTTTTSFSIDNVAPAPVITGNASVNENTAISLSVAHNDVGSADTQTYLWSVTKDGNAYDLTGVTTNASGFTFTPNLWGAYVVSVTVTDDDGGTNTATHNVTVNSVAPNVAITGVPSGPRGEGTPLTLGSTVSDVPAEPTLTYAWSVTRGGQAFALPGGTVTNGTTFEFTPTDNGLYRVTLAVTDSAGVTGSSTTTNINITNALPFATISGEPGGSISEGTAVNLTVDAQDPGSEDTLTYAWSVRKNGSAWTLPGGTVTNTENFSFTPTDNGTYIATVAIVDDDGGPISVSSTAVTVTNVNPTPAITGAPTGGDEGTAISLGSSITDPGTDDSQTYAWSVTKDGQPFALPGGASTTASTFSFVPTDNGNYVISLTVTDDDGGTGTIATSAITIDNVDPTATLTGPTSGTEGDTLSYAVTPADAGSADTHSYLWSVTKDGNAYDLTGLTVNTSSFAFVPTDDGDYVVSVVVTDDDSGAVTKTANVAVANAEPVITITGAPTTGNEGTAITVGSTLSDAGTDDTHTLGWSVYKNGSLFTLPGGTTTDASSFTFTPTDNGSYVIRLTALDDDGGSETVQTDAIVVANVNPTAVITGTPVGSIDEGTEVSLTATPSDVGTLDTAFTYLWSVTKDGDAVDLTGVDTTSAAFAFTPDDNGSYIATVVVKDKDLGSVSVSTAAITVENVAPTASIIGAPSTVAEGNGVFANSSVADVGTADTQSYAWSVTKDGQPYTLPISVSTTSSSLSFTPTDNGNYVLSLTVTDDDGDSVTATSSTITVTNANPDASIDGPSTATEGDTVSYTAEASDPGTDDTFSYAWSVTKDGDAYDLGNTVVSEAAFSFVPADNGEYVVTLTVTDDDGGSITETASLAVANADPIATIVDAPTSGTEGSPLTFGSSVIDAGTLDSFSYLWSVTKDGDAYDLTGVTVNGEEFTFTPSDNGSYVVSLTVTDNDEGSATVSTAAISVANVPPTAEITGAPVEPINEGDFVTLGVTVEDVGSLDTTFAYQWSVTKDGDAYDLGNTVVSEAAFSFVPADNGTYIATVVVTDKDSGSVSVSSTAITVENVAPQAIISFAPTTGEEGTELVSASLASDAGLADTLSYLWTVTKDGDPFALPEGVSATDSSFAFVPTDNGEYVLTLTVVDDDLASTVVSSDPIIVTNVNPSGSISGPVEANEGDTVTFTATPTDAGAADTEFTYEWTVERVGDVQLSTPELQGPTYEFTPTDDGEYLVSVLITDKDGGSSTITHTINVYNVEPTVQIVETPSTGVEGEPITGGSDVSDPSNDELTYGWTVYRNGEHFMLPDGTEITGQSLTFTPTDNGNYVLRLTVLDGDGGSTTTNSSPVVVANAAPVVAIVGDTEVAEGSTLPLTSEVSDEGADDVESLEYAWTVKRGDTTVASGSTADFDFTPTVHGTYTVTLVVTDKDGDSTTTQSTINVTNVAPADAVISGLPESMNESEIVTLTGSASDVEDDTLTYDWNVVRNGSQFATFEGEEFAFDPHARGNYQITLTVTDSAGEETTTTESITVDNVAPTGSFTGPTSPVLLGKSASFNLSIEDVPPTQALTVVWNFGDGNTANGAYLGSQTGITRSHTYAAPGTYSVTITVGDGVDSTVLSRTVNVSPAGITVDAFDSTKTGLYVYGTSAADTIAVAPTTGGNYGVTMNGVSLGTTFAPTGKVYIYGNGGANTITVDGQIDAVVFAGTSTASNVTTGNGNDIIVGTSAADRLNGQAGRDIVIGAAGADTLYAGDSEDLIIAQGTTWMTSINSLKSVKTAWDSGSQTMAARRTSLKATGLFNSGSLIADAGNNNLYGEARADWMVFNTATDKLRDYQAALDLLN